MERKKAMISIPMRSHEDFENHYNELKEKLEGKGYEVLNTIFDFDDVGLVSSGVVHIPLYYIANSINILSKCDILVLADGWRSARGCLIEAKCAELYGVKLMEEKDLDKV